MQADDDSQCGSGPHFLPISSPFRLAIWIDVLVGAQCSNVNWWRHTDVCDANRFGQEIYIPTCCRPNGHILVYSRDPSQTDIHTHTTSPRNTYLPIRTARTACTAHTQSLSIVASTAYFQSDTFLIFFPFPPFFIKVIFVLCFVIFGNLSFI